MRITETAKTHDSVNPKVERAALKVIWRAIFCTLTKKAPLKYMIWLVKPTAMDTSACLPYISKIAENEGLSQVETNSDDVLCIGMREL